MTKKTRKHFKHRSVIETSPVTGPLKNISKEPEMQKLKDLFDQMTDAEKARTVDHLKAPAGSEMGSNHRMRGIPKSPSRSRMGTLKNGKAVQDDLSAEDLEWLRQFFAKSRFIYARTMPQWPHEYTLRKEADEEEFLKVVCFIREHGYDRRFKTASYITLRVDEFIYWTMGDALNFTILVNRARVEDQP